MKAILSSTLLLALTCFSGAGEFHVSPSGNDANPGTAEKPFATLEKARDAARAEKGSKVILAPGYHRRTKTFELDARDSGTVFTGKEASIVGSVAVPNGAVKPVTDAKILERLLPEVRGKVMEIDLKALGITDFGDIGPRGFRRPYVPAPLELIVDGKPLDLARWPDAGQPGEPMGKVLDKGPATRNGEKPTRGGIFEFKTDRPARWTHADDVWITGLFENGYADNTVKVKGFDFEKKTLTTVHSHMYGFGNRGGWNRWTALNLLEEISVPGEFMADRKTGKVYFLPLAGFDAAKSKLEVTVMQEPLVAIEGATGTVFDGVEFANSRGMGVYIERGANNRIQNATLRNFGMVAISVGKGISPDPEYRHGFTGTPISRALGSWHEHIYDNTTFDREGGTGHGIVNCEIYNIGAGAISLGGGDRLKLTPAGNFVENCDIHHFNRWDRTYKGGVNIEGVGNRIAHCKIHEAPALAIYLHGNDHVIEYNEVARVMLEGDDMGAFYVGRDPTERGNIIRYNYWHHLANHHMTWCLYFDDSGGDSSKVYGNVFLNAGNHSTVFIAGGSDFVVENNIFVDCKRPIFTQGFRANNFEVFKKRMAQVGWDRAPWTERYPEFAGYIEAKRPRNNRIEKNLIVKQADPRFVDGAAENFSLKPGADTGIEGFQVIPFDKIGLKNKPANEPAKAPSVAPPAEVKTSAGDEKLGLTTAVGGQWKFYPAANPDPALPRVLLIGDSICGGYRGAVIRDLKGKANVDVWLTPVAENDPGLPGDLEKVVKQGPYAVVHFNIGLHGWPKGRIADGQYEPLMRKYVEVLRKNGPNSKFIWASSTPITVKGKAAELDPVNNPTMTGRNAEAAKIMQESGIAVNDLYSLVVEQRAQLAVGDQFHWKPAGSELMAKQIVEFINKALPAKK